MNDSEAEIKRMGRFSAGDLNPKSALAFIIAGLLLLGLTAWFFDWASDHIVAGWTALPKLVGSPLHSLLAAVVVILAGKGFFWVRSRQPFAYAMIELGVAAGGAYYACTTLAQRADRVSWLLAIMASVFISVRGHDNLDKWYKTKRSGEENP